MTTHLHRHTWTPWRKKTYSFFSIALQNLRGKLLDLGSGPEQFRDLTWRFEKTSVDFELYPTTDIIADITKPLPLRDETFDVVFSSSCIEHILYPLTVFTEVYRILKPGGTFVFSSPFFVRVHNAPYDYNRYTKYALEQLLKDAGFTYYTIIPIGDPLDVLEAAEGQCLSSIKKTHPLATYIRKLYRFELRLLSPLLQAPPDEHLPLGYGVVAKKSS